MAHTDDIDVDAGLSRRRFLGTAGALVVSWALPLPLPAAAEAASFPLTIAPDMLDSWLAVLPDGSVIASVGKIEAGMGIGTSFAQIIAEELDVPLARVQVRMGDTATTVDQRGTGSSNGIITAGPILRRAGAQARHTLLAMAAQRLGAPADQLVVADGVVSVAADPQRRVGYGELIGGKRFDLQLSDKVEAKPPARYTLVGKPVQRFDIPAKVVGAYPYLVDQRVPGMLHGRVVRPPEAGARLLAVAPGQKFPGLVKIVAEGDFVGVVCRREEQAIAAARELKLTWSRPQPMFSASYDALYETLRTSTPKSSKRGTDVGDVDAALAGAAGVVEARYDYPFQSHACMGPACALADVTADGATVWMGGQKPYGLRKALAGLLGQPAEKVRVVWVAGPGSYGMNDADDAAIDAALLSRAVGRPVRLQYSRADGTGWDPKGPPVTTRMRGALDGAGQVLAYDLEARGYSGRIRPSGTDAPGDALSVQLIGGAKAKSSDLFQYSDENYRFPNKRKTSHLVAWEQSLPTGLRTAHLRDPDGMSMCFASECFIDELAHRAGRDPVEFRLAHLAEGRDRAVVAAVARKAGWVARPAPAGKRAGVVRGRGIAYAPRAGTMVALVAEVEVNMDSGKMRVTRFVVAHDCGFVVNPMSLAGTIEANLIQAMSRAMYEQVEFTPSRVTSVDWATYPVAEMADMPDAIDIEIVNNHVDAKSLGAGEPSTRPVAAAIGNALFDATGVRIRRVPFTSAALRAAFRAA
ncbi:molybdopterin cofactor-binding domain-containing protein [Massilia sp. TWR1-2-2]|uniref:xanthine dehydrogenase family protein molybdopterin-binding subunit n=1 Tax=Massilia sp. TWR1-2-2 TaxID=2804584 RepID=UPI003CF94BAC